MRIRPIHAADFYKTGHLKQYPEGTEFVYSNMTARSDKLAKFLPYHDHKVVLFGLQGVCSWLLRDLWNREFFARPKSLVLAEYRSRMGRALGADACDTSHVAALHDLGYLPILIKALPEGTRVPIKVPLFTIQNTRPEFFWLVNYLETQLSAELWKPINTATTAYEFKRLLVQYAKATGAPLDFVPWQGHDFSMRGMSGIHDAAQSGAGHLLSFFGTDTIPALDYLDDYYHGNLTNPLGGSVPATEHSVMCMGGHDDELGTFNRLITETYPHGVVSIVSDTWDFWNVITNTAAVLKSEIMARSGKVVFRPDSGDPVKIICGDDDAEPGSPAHRGAVECLWSIFGGTTTPTGHRLLDEHVGLIYGDSITLERASEILMRLEWKGFASTNVVLGIGSFTYQYATRDNLGQAVKATYGVVNGEGRELFKDPKTDSGTKKSARGLLRIEHDGNGYVLHERQTPEQEKRGLLEPVFCDGQLCRVQTLQGIRDRLAAEPFGGDLVKVAA